MGSETSTVRPWLIALGSLVALGLLALRVGLVVENVFPSYDGTYYLKQAMQFAQEGRLTFGNFPPGWPMLVGIAATLGGATDPAGYLQVAEVLNLLGAAASAGLLLAWGWPRLGWWAAAPALSLLALPEHVNLSFSDLSDMSYLICLLAAFVLHERGRAFASGLLFGYAYVIRPEGGLIFAVFLATLVRDAPRVAVSTLSGALLPVVAFQVFAVLSTGEIALSGKRGWLTATFRDRTGWEVSSHVARNAGTVARQAVGLLGVPLLLLGVYGAVRAPGRWLVLWATVPLLPFFSFSMSQRYLLVPAVGCLVGAVVGAREIVRASPRRSVAVWGMAVLWVASMGLAGREEYGRIRANYEFYPTMREAGDWVAQHSEPEDLVVGRKPYVAFWAQRPFRRVPLLSSLDALGDWALEAEARYLAVHLGVSEAMAPELLSLTGSRGAAWLRRVETFSLPGRPEETLYLFEVQREGPES